MAYNTSTNLKITLVPTLTVDDDELIDVDNYTRDTREFIISDNCVDEIIAERSTTGFSQKQISDAFKYLRSNNFTEFRKAVGKNKSIVNVKFCKTYMIHEACRLANPECVSLLLFLGAKCSTLDDEGFTAQHRAVMSKSTVIVDILSLFGNSMNIKDKNGNTPFYYALLQKDEDMIKTLMTYKADPFIRDTPNNDSMDIFLNSVSGEISEILSKYIGEF
ncbi:hypothetical protein YASMINEVIRUS_981 [Yasminevirus sp. GU-2018]|uniref:Uncharacterized protein n=1 Tax=Yasminevirus sp. GU-2018 TaxID=2420051 RepID=A0A5K0U932_9VIRU|nr:hypothetical protein YASMINEVIRUS_981 [Yasminevirus sp. GU-2018]